MARDWAAMEGALTDAAVGLVAALLDGESLSGVQRHLESADERVVIGELAVLLCVMKSVWDVTKYSFKIMGTTMRNVARKVRVIVRRTEALIQMWERTKLSDNQVQPPKVHVLRSSMLQGTFFLRGGGEVKIPFRSDDTADPAIHEELMLLIDAGRVIIGISIGKPEVFISEAALETIVTLPEEQAIGWIRTLRRAATK